MLEELQQSCSAAGNILKTISARSACTGENSLLLVSSRCSKHTVFCFPITTCTGISFIPRFSFFFPATSSLLSLDDSRGLITSRQGLLWTQGRYSFCTRQLWLGQPAGCPKSSWWLSTSLYLLICLADDVQIQYLSQTSTFFAELVVCIFLLHHLRRPRPIFKNFFHTYSMPFVLN